MPVYVIEMKRNYPFDSRSKLLYLVKDGKEVEIKQPYSRPSKKWREAFNKIYYNPPVPPHFPVLYSIPKKCNIIKLENEKPEELFSRIKRTYARELGRAFPYAASSGKLFTCDVMRDIEKLAKQVFPFINNPPKPEPAIYFSKPKPNQVEIKLQEILNNLFPTEFSLNVISSKKIGRKIPDFIHNHLPIIVEMFGDYWHGPLMTGRSYEEEEKYRIEYFASFGYKTVIIWESEVENLGIVSNRINLAKKLGEVGGI